MDYYSDSLGYKKKILIPYMYVGTVSTFYLSIIRTEEMLTNQFQLSMYYQISSYIYIAKQKHPRCKKKRGQVGSTS